MIDTSDTTALSRVMILRKLWRAAADRGEAVEVAILARALLSLLVRLTPSDLELFAMWTAEQDAAPLVRVEVDGN